MLPPCMKGLKMRYFGSAVFDRALNTPLNVLFFMVGSKSLFLVLNIRLYFCFVFLIHHRSQLICPIQINV